MNEIIYMAFALLTGLLLGAFFFGGLWFTVKKAVTSKIPAVWFLGSFLIRVSFTMLGFYYMAAGIWQRLLVCGLGFVIARYVIVRVTKFIDEKEIQLKNEVNHEA